MYRIDAQGKIIRIDGAEIPRDVTNPAYQQFIHWQTHGPHPLAAQEEVPQEVVEKAEMPPKLAELIGKGK